MLSGDPKFRAILLLAYAIGVMACSFYSAYEQARIERAGGHTCTGFWREPSPPC